MTKLKHADQISPVFHEPYLLNGYRQTDTSFCHCIRYTVVLHNDVGNFWTHFLPAVAWMVWLVHLSCTSIDFTDPYWYPLLVIWIGACCYATCSAAAHLFACKSLQTRQVAFMIDYHGITLYATGGFLAYYFYERQIGFGIFRYKYSFILTSVIVNTVATLTCCLSRFYWKEWRYYARSGSYVLPYILGLSSFNLRFLYCMFTGEQCEFQTLHLHIVAFILSLFMVFFFVSKIPERFSPGSFDYFFHSHQLFHICAAAMTSMQLYMVKTDALNRRDLLTADPYLVPDAYTTLLPFFAVFTMGTIIIGVLSFFVFNGALISNKIEPLKKHS